MQTYNSLTEFATGLESLSFQLSHAERAVQGSLIYLRDSLPPPPPSPPQGVPYEDQPWDSEKQRRWYYWAVSTGLLENPYSRTNRLEEGFVISDPISTERGIQAELYNNYPQAVFIIGDAGVIGEQAAIHEGRWWEFDKTITALEEATLDHLEKLIFMEMDAAW